MAIHAWVHRSRGDFCATVEDTLTLEGPFEVGDEVEFEVDHSGLTVEGDDTAFATFDGCPMPWLDTVPGFMFSLVMDGTDGNKWRGLCRYVGAETVIGVAAVEHPAPGDDVTITWHRRGCLL